MNLPAKKATTNDNSYKIPLAYESFLHTARLSLPSKPNHAKAMKTTRDKRRKAELKRRQEEESFRFQVMHGLKSRPDCGIPADNIVLDGELESIFHHGLAKGMLQLRDMINAVKDGLGISPVDEMCSLNGNITPYLLGITSVNPLEYADIDLDRVCRLADKRLTEVPLKVEICYNDDARNKVFDWLTEHGYRTAVMYYQTIVRLENVFVTIKRTTNNVQPHKTQNT